MRHHISNVTCDMLQIGSHYFIDFAKEKIITWLFLIDVYYTSHQTYQNWDITGHMSMLYVTSDTLHVTHNMSHVTCDFIL